jgi:hypothetical protein
MDSSSQANESLEALQDIKRMMERSSRFISLSGLSGVSAGICALIGAYIAHGWIMDYYGGATLGGEVVRGTMGRHGYMHDEAEGLKWRLIGLSLAVLTAALISSTWFTWRKARRSNLPIWDLTSKKLIVNMSIPLLTGGVFLLGMFHNTDWDYVAPTCLVFYGLALVNASKYTLKDIRYLGFLEIALGCIGMYYLQRGLYFWALGFGVLHIIYGLIMWWKYERGGAA